MIGFNNENKNELSIYEKFIGKPGHYGVGNVNITGVLKEVNLEEGYLAVQPSIIGLGDNGVRIETEVPTIISIAVGNPISMRPLKENDLEKIVEEHKKNIEAKSEK